MLCVAIILVSVINCGVTETRDGSDEEDLSISTVSIASSPSGIDSRIVGGSPTTIENFPYAVQILNNGQFSCGGSILTTRHVLSAAHCYHTSNGTFLGPAPFSIRAGTTFLNEGGSVHSVSTIIIHQDYNVTISDNDIVVLVLSSRLRFEDSVKSASIPIQGETLADNSTVVALGWGRTIAGGEVSNVLSQVSIRTVNQDTCQQRYSWLSNYTGLIMAVTDNMFCAGLLDIGGADTCQGDSGGPLSYNGVIVGITSWGASCAHPNYPGVYAEVSRYSNWINETVTKYNSSPRDQAGIVGVLMPFVFVIFRV